MSIVRQSYKMTENSNNYREILSRLQAESLLKQIRQQLEIIGACNCTVAQVDDYFSNLEQYVVATMLLCRENAAIEENWRTYCVQLSDQLRQLHVAESEEMIRIQEWTDCRMPEMFGSLLGVSRYEDKIKLLRRLRLIERMIQMVQANQATICSQCDWLFVDEGIQYFDDIFQ